MLKVPKLLWNESENRTNEIKIEKTKSESNRLESGRMQFWRKTLQLCCIRTPGCTMEKMERSLKGKFN
ncbi:unnamed protein product, partial [Nesidiocoris tenuis]